MPDVATTDRGALGVPIGATFEVAVPARELPMLFCATTLTVYAVPLTSPVTVHDGADGRATECGVEKGDLIMRNRGSAIT